MVYTSLKIWGEAWKTQYKFATCRNDFDQQRKKCSLRFCASRRVNDEKFKRKCQFRNWIFAKLFMLK